MDPDIKCIAAEKTYGLLFEMRLTSSYVCPMTQNPNLVDRRALDAARKRVDPNRGYFLHDMAIDDVHDRLSFVNKSFTDVVIVTGCPAPWAAAFPQARIIADDDMLDLAEKSCDLIIHAMALHWANDPVGQMIQCNRALRPDGMMIAVMLGGSTLNELRTSLAEAEVAIAGGLSPRVLPMGEIQDVGALLQRSGFALPVADSAVITTSYETLFDLMRDLRAMGETNAMTGRRKTFAPRALFLRAAEIYAQTYHDEGGRILASFEQIILTGWAPDASQSKPLRPGSAQMRLADALGTKENPI
jgi:SAM-dependent methyltransferase